VVSGSQDLLLGLLRGTCRLPRVDVLHILFVACPLCFVSILVPKKAVVSRSLWKSQVSWGQQGLRSFYHPPGVKLFPVTGGE